MAQTTPYVLNEHLDTVQDNAISKLSWTFGESKWKPYRVIASTSSSGITYVPKHEDVDQYDPYAIPSEKIPW